MFGLIECRLALVSIAIVTPANALIADNGNAKVAAEMARQQRWIMGMLPPANSAAPANLQESNGGKMVTDLLHGPQQFERSVPGAVGFALRHIAVQRRTLFAQPDLRLFDVADQVFHQPPEARPVIHLAHV